MNAPPKPPSCEFISPLVGVGDVSFLAASLEVAGGECRSEEGLAPSADGLELHRKMERWKQGDAPSNVRCEIWGNISTLNR